ncbi:hypothetical protein PFICI_08521 [Pestalotiopsis fici W106-1]|uniref:Uncharacterized protein n=1 Tax=Pestalotiopsis fici (strain W106-1 / CGMCC3.15140) TaxID=1229662 RepID=W3WXT2_PESFW|nr:uncharacterized protein PFICI_08521 [Pestalotiopsis fici W106-1]ETS78668.1 hypothetical protein PFICI_08521 [Pestalotiopsis fici W106-1]
MTAIKSDPYGFCDPRDAGEVFLDADEHQIFTDYCRRMEIEMSRDMSAFANQSFIPARDTAEQNMTHEANAEQRSTGVVELSTVVDHLGGWEDEFQGYNRATNSAAPPRVLG